MKYVIFGSMSDRRNAFIFDIIMKTKNKGCEYKTTTTGTSISSFSCDNDEYIIISYEDRLRGRRLSDYTFLIDGHNDNDIMIACSHSYNIPISWDDYLESISKNRYVVELL